jgi:hypothetical protein
MERRLEAEADGFITAIELFAPQSYFMNISARTVREWWWGRRKKNLFIALDIVSLPTMLPPVLLSRAQKANTGGEFFFVRLGSGSARKYIIIVEAWRGGGFPRVRSKAYQ